MATQDPTRGSPTSRSTARRAAMPCPGLNHAIAGEVTHISPAR